MKIVLFLLLMAKLAEQAEDVATNNDPPVDEEVLELSEKSASGTAGNSRH